MFKHSITIFLLIPNGLIFCNLEAGNERRRTVFINGADESLHSARCFAFGSLTSA